MFLLLLFVAIISTLILLSKPFWGLLCVVFIFPFEQVSILPGLTIVVPMGGALAVSWFIHNHRLKIYWDRTFLLFLGLIAASVLSLLSIGSYYSDIQSIIQVCILAFLTSQIVNSFDRLKTVIWIVGLSFLLNGIYALIFGSASPEELDLGVRETGFFGDPNFVSINSLAFLPAVVALCYHEKKNLMKNVLLFVIILSLALTIIFAFSRGAFVAAFGVILISLTQKKILLKKKFLFLFLPIIIAFGIFITETLLWYSQTYDLLAISQYRLSDYQKQVARTAQLVDFENYKNFSGIMRLEGWIGGLRMFLDNPIFGVGYGQSKYLLPVYSLNIFYQINSEIVPHNSYIEMLAELGIFGASFFILIMVTTLKQLYLSSKNRYRVFVVKEQIIIWGLFLGTCGYMIGQFFVSAQIKKYLWLLVGLSIAIKRIEKLSLIQRRMNLEDISKYQNSYENHIK